LNLNSHFLSLVLEVSFVIVLPRTSRRKVENLKAKKKFCGGFEAFFFAFFFSSLGPGHRIMSAHSSCAFLDYKFPVKLNDCVALCGGQIE
jgi:hypothetical protein